MNAPASNLSAYSPTGDGPVHYDTHMPDSSATEPPATPEQRPLPTPPARQRQRNYGELPAQRRQFHYKDLPPDQRNQNYASLGPESANGSYGSAAEARSVPGMSDPPERPSFFKRNLKAIIGTLVVGSTTLVVGGAVTVGELAAHGIVP